MYLLHAFGTVSILGNVLFTAIAGGLSLIGGGVGSWFGKQVMAGLWPVLFGLLAVRCSLSQDPTTQLCCLPIQVPTKWYPLILGCIFQLFGIQIALFCGIGVGYLYAYPNSHLACSSEKLREYENGRCACISSDPSFISVDNAQALPVWNPFTMQGDQAGGAGAGGSGSAGSVGGGGMMGGIRSMFRDDGESDNGSSQQAFSGRGYTLGTGQQTGGSSSFFTSSAVETKDPSESKSSSRGGGKNTDSRRNVLAERVEARLRQQQAKKQPQEVSKKEVEMEMSEMSTVDLSSSDAKTNPPAQTTAPTLEPPPSMGLPEEHAENFAAQYDVDLQSLVARGYPRQAALSALVANGGDFQMALSQLQGS
uniref:UBA domain-containing protein n=2 Tax=Lotharella globosa TaxID=91324 RepID=A0A7S3Y8D0_9EUKA